MIQHTETRRLPSPPRSRATASAKTRPVPIVAPEPAAPSSWRLFRRLLGLFRPYRKGMILGVSLSALSTLAGIGLMGLSGWFLASMGLAGVAGASMDYFTPAAIIRGAAIVRTAGRYAERLVNHDLTLRVLSGLRVHLFTRLLPLAPAGTEVLGHAELFSRLRADVDRLEHAALAVFLPILVASIALPLVTVVLACYVWPVAVASAAAILLVGVALPWWLGRRSVATSIAMVRTEATLRALTSDALLGAAELRVYDGAAAQARRIAALTAEHGRQRSRLDRLQAVGGAVAALAAQLATITGLVLGARAVQHHGIAPAELAMVVLLTMAQFEAVASLPEAISQLQATLVAAARVFALIDAAPRVVEPDVPAAASAPVPPASSPAPSPGVDLVFRDVFLRYGDDRPWALRGLSLDLPAGRRLAIVGPSGAGKSSLIGALLRFHPVQAGRIELAGRALDTYAGDAVRGMIAVVEQRTHIFNGSLRDNLLVARPDATARQIDEALRAAQLAEVVAGLPEGLDTWLGEAGVRLSGGEARRVAIARAVLADRPIVVLDEPTEGLDAQAAQAVLNALATLTAGRSVILITHRLAGLASLVDAQVTMREGRIVRPA